MLSLLPGYDDSTPTDIELEIYLGGTSEFVPFMNFDGTRNDSAMATSTSSISEPADAESVLAVGAIDYVNWTTGPLEEYSSQGPTNNWNSSDSRIKPDIMGPVGVTTYTYGKFIVLRNICGYATCGRIGCINFSHKPRHDTG